METTRKRVYAGVYLLTLKTITDNKEYLLSVEFMDGYPRLVVRNREERYPTVKATFTTLGLMTFISAMNNVIENGNEITLDSKNFKYTDNVKSDNLVSVAKVTVKKHESGATMICLEHEGKSYDFPVVLDPKFFNFYRNGTNIDNQMFDHTAKAYTELMKETLSAMTAYFAQRNVSEVEVESKQS